MDEFDELAQAIIHEFIVRRKTAEDYTARILRSRFGWRKREDKLPNKEDVVLSIDSIGDFNFAEIDEDGDLVTGRVASVTHWMPLPEPPQKKS